MMTACVDMFSRYMQVRTQRSKNKTLAMQSVLDTDDARGLTYLFTDAGREFVNSMIRCDMSLRSRTWCSHITNVHTSV